MVGALLLALAPFGIGADHGTGEAPRRWGEEGHQMAARAAVETLPPDVPAFFRGAAEQLVYLDPEPDRWRERSQVEMAQAYAYDHYLDLERVPPGALAEPDRFAFLRRLWVAGIERPEQSVGLLPYRIVELYQRLVTEWRLWREAPDARRRAWVEQRIVNDAGILGHYVTDAANPQHTTIHFNGWDDDTANPGRYTLDRGFHARFEAAFVGRHVGYPTVREHAEQRAPTSVSGSARQEVLRYIQASNAQVDTLYRLERDVGFDLDAPAAPAAIDFAADRLGAGAAMLRDLWWSAWLESGAAP